MVTGLNTDVEYEGRVYHVQTEDKGRDRPILESLVYCGGEIVGSRRSSYEDLARSPDFDEAEVGRRLELQHQAVIREVLSGRFDPEGPKPFGYDIITNRSLDEVVLEYLSKEIGLEKIRLELEGHPPLREGSSQVLRLRVTTDGPERPVAGATVLAKLFTTRAKPRLLFSGKTDIEGRLEARLELPLLGDSDAAVLFLADAGGKNAELKQLVLKASSSPEPAG
jgi:hypothetical protein